MDLRTYCVGSSLIGGAVWLARTALTRPAPFQPAWAVSILLLAPLVLVPLGLRLAAPPGRRPLAWRAAVILQLPAAILLLPSFALPTSLGAAALALPWLVCTVLIALFGLARLRSRGLRRPEELCLDAGLVYIAVGGGWTILTRYGSRPLDFEAIIVLLTAIHFHYAGFILPILTGLAGRTLGGLTSRLATLGVIVGVPLVAVGITASQVGLPSLVECLAAWFLALAGLLTAWLHLRLVLRPGRPPGIRLLWGVAGSSLAFGMLLAALYGAREFGGLAWLDIPWMRTWHGTADALGFGLAGTLAWSLETGRLCRSGSRP